MTQRKEHSWNEWDYENRLTPVWIMMLTSAFVFLSHILMLVLTQLVCGRHKSSTVFARSNAGVVGSNPTRGMNVCVRFSVFVLCVRRGLTTGWSPSRESYRLCIGLRNWKSGQGPTKDCRTIDGWMNELMSRNLATTMNFSAGGGAIQFVYYVQFVWDKFYWTPVGIHDTGIYFFNILNLC
jgi:hypothetical protein